MSNNAKRQKTTNTVATRSVTAKNKTFQGEFGYLREIDTREPIPEEPSTSAAIRGRGKGRGRGKAKRGLVITFVIRL